MIKYLKFEMMETINIPTRNLIYMHVCISLFIVKWIFILCWFPIYPCRMSQPTGHHT